MRRNNIGQGKNEPGLLYTPFLMSPKIWLLFAAILCQLAAAGQNRVDTSFGKITPNDFNVSSPAVDSSASVVVLEDIGQSELEGYPRGWRVEYSRYHRLLIKNRKGFDAASILITYSAHDNGPVKLITLRANTYNLEDGKVVKTEVGDEEMYLDTGRDGNMKERWTFPNLKEGSIIEYTYAIFDNSIYNLPSWDFQGDYPRVKSEYTIVFPAAFNYVVSKQGFIPLPKTMDSAMEKIAVADYTVKTIVYKAHWKLRDIPPLREETYTSSMDNYFAKVSFQLSEFTELDNRKRVKVMDNWGRLNERMFKDEAFGGIMTTNSHWLRKEMRSIVEDTLTDADKAKTLFYYVRDHFSSMGRSVFSGDGLSLKDIFKARKGTVAEINLLLTALLREAGITADAVILSTRDNGWINATYPVTERFNYVIVRSRIGGKDYFLDATSPRLGFGRLPLECYNGYARVISERADSAILIPDSLMESRVTTAFIYSNDAGDSLLGKYADLKGNYTSDNIRTEVVENGEKNYFDDIRKSYPFDVRLTGMQIDSLASYDNPVTIRYTVGWAMTGDDRLYFNPMLSVGLKENPFAEVSRQCPVEMPFAVNTLYVLQMEIPSGYVIEDLPKPMRVRLNEGDGSYEYGFAANGQILQFRSRLILKKTFFQPEEYQSLRDFYAMVVKKQSEVVVLKKTK
jgi:hypothetical protein